MLISKCEQSYMFSVLVTAIGIGLMILIVLVKF